MKRINHDKARRYFGILGNNDLVLHHVDTTLRHTNIERYEEWNPEDLIVMTRSEHMLLHQSWGHPQTLETRQKISNSTKGKVLKESTKQLIGKSKEIPVLQLDLDGNIIQEFKSALEAEIATGTARSKICLCCKGKRKSSNGYKWQYSI